MTNLAPYCPTCMGQVTMWHESNGYVFQHISQVWKCLTCGTIVEAQIPCIIRRPDPTTGQQEG